MPVSLHGLNGYRRAFGDVVPSALLAFRGGGIAFRTAGAPIERDAQVASAGLEAQLSKAVTLGASYAGQIGARAGDHAVRGYLTLRW
ncbi:MAG: autotransporter domain-containing protein [Actinomycetospora chiangmaiensis]|nr:autotransporter domain-containing protein [Actinomycetospora chiangmaiensis]